MSQWVRGLTLSPVRAAECECHCDCMNCSAGFHGKRLDSTAASTCSLNVSRVKTLVHKLQSIMEETNRLMCEIFTDISSYCAESSVDFEDSFKSPDGGKRRTAQNENSCDSDSGYCDTGEEFTSPPHVCEESTHNLFVSPRKPQQNEAGPKNDGPKASESKSCSGVVLREKTSEPILPRRCSRLPPKPNWPPTRSCYVLLERCSEISHPRKGSEEGTNTRTYINASTFCPLRKSLAEYRQFSESLTQKRGQHASTPYMRKNKRSPSKYTT